MSASLPADMVNQKLADLGIPNRFSITSSRSRPHPARPAIKKGPRRHHDARLQAQWNHDAAALDVATGKVIGECMPRHRSKDFLASLKKAALRTPADLDLHLILDN